MTALSRTERLGLAVERTAVRRLGTFGAWVYRRTKGRVAKLWHVDALLLTTRGRRSGRARTVVLQDFPDGASMIVAAANDGGAAHPGWYHNLVAQPDANVEVMGRRPAVRAEVLSAEEATAAWPRIPTRAPGYERFRRATSRTIPIVRLDPAGDAQAREVSE